MSILADQNFSFLPVLFDYCCTVSVNGKEDDLFLKEMNGRCEIRANNISAQ